MSTSGVIALPRGFGNLKEDRTYVAAYPMLNSGTRWNKFQSSLLNSIKNTSSMDGNPDHLLEDSYELALKRNPRNPFTSTGLQRGYLYPTCGSSRNSELIVKSFVDGLLIDVMYSSHKLGNNGQLTKIARLYVGKVHKISKDKQSFVLKVGKSYRHFYLNQVSRLDSYSTRDKGYMRHLILEFKMGEDGAASLVWTQVDDENSELFETLWGPKPVSAAPQSAPKVVKPSTPRKSIAKIPVPKSYAAYVKNLSGYYGNLLLITSTAQEPSTVMLKLTEFELNSQNGKLKLFGENGASFEGDISKIAIQALNEEDMK